MKIVFLSHNGQLEGAPIALVHLAVGLEKRGYLCDIVSSEEGSLSLLCDNKSVAYHIVPGLFSAEEAKPRLKKILRSLQPDIVCVNTIAGCHLVRSIRASCPHLKIFWYIHESDRQEHERMYGNSMAEAFSAADRVIFASSATMNVYADSIEDRGAVVSPGIDLDAIDKARLSLNRRQLRMQCGFPDDAFIFTMIGTLCLRKGQQEFIDAALELFEELPDAPTHFLLIGKNWNRDRSAIDEALDRASLSGFRDRFHVVLPTPDIANYYAFSDAYVCNSYVESFPLVILEAMAHELPIIASRTYGVIEQIIDEVTALAVLSGHKGMLKTAMRRLLDDPDCAKAMGRKGRERVEKCFTLNRMVDAFERLCLSDGRDHLSTLVA